MRTLGTCAALALAMLAPAISGAETFEILDPPGALSPADANLVQHGVVAGSVFTNSGTQVFTFSRTAGYTLFSVPDQKFLNGVSPSGIDGAGRVYGTLMPTQTEVLSFVRDTNGDVEEFAVDLPNVQFTSINDVNVRGTGVGQYSVMSEDTGALVTQGFMRVATGQIVVARYPGASFTAVLANNDQGEMAGYAGFPGQAGVQPFFRGALGPWTLFNLPATCMPPSQFAINLSLNESGAAAGHCEVGPAVFRGFVRKKSGQLATFNVPGAISTKVAGIADNGNVAGTFTDTEGSHAYIRRAAGPYVTFDAPTARPGTTVVTNYSAEGDLVGRFVDAGGIAHAFVRFKE